MQTRINRIALCATGACAVSTVAIADPPQFTIVDLGAQVDSISESYAADINSSGEVTGWSRVSSGQEKVTLWSGGTGELLNPGQYDGRFALALNDDGMIVGGFPGRTLGWVYDDAFACVPHEEWCTQFDYIYSASVARDVNNAGVFTGQISPEDAIGPTEPYLGTLNPDGTIAIERLGGYLDLQPIAGYGINSANDVVVWAGSWFEQNYALLYRGDAVYELPTLGGLYNKPEAINDTGFAVGFVAEADDPQFPYDGQAALWNVADEQNLTLQTLGLLEGTVRTWAYDINNENVVVGSAQDTNFNQRAFIYIDGALIDLADLVQDGDAWTLEVALGINDANQIVGYGEKSGETGTRAFLLEPVTGPAADMNQDGTIGVGDLLMLLAMWDTNDAMGDLDGDGIVGVGDLLILLAEWS